MTSKQKSYLGISGKQLGIQRALGNSENGQSGYDAPESKHMRWIRRAPSPQVRKESILIFTVLRTSDTVLDTTVPKITQTATSPSGHQVPGPGAPSAWATPWPARQRPAPAGGTRRSWQSVSERGPRFLHPDSSPLSTLAVLTLQRRSSARKRHRTPARSAASVTRQRGIPSGSKYQKGCPRAH